MSLPSAHTDLHPETHEHLANALETMVDQSATIEDPTLHSAAVSPAHQSAKHAWFKDLFDAGTADKLFVHEHMGNYVVVDRVKGTQVFESMPVYVRVGMHLLFYGKEQTRLLKWGTVEHLLTEQTLKQGKIYNSTDPAIVVPHIKAFIETYSVNLAELDIQDPAGYTTINEFFARKLKAGARIIDDPQDPSVITSAADCRLTVWPTVDAAQKFWVKGRNFSIKTLLNNDEGLTALFGAKPSLAIFRLAPQDYHRYHAPIEGTLETIIHVPGEYYTVNATIINEEFDVFTANRRDISIIHSTTLIPGQTTPVALVAIGAMLVGAIEWDRDPSTYTEPITFQKGDDLGCFKYGGSTVICVFPENVNMQWDSDLIAASEKRLETVVRVGEHIGKVTV